MTVRRRRLLVFGLHAALAAVALAAWLLRPPGTAITRDNAEKIQRGMTLTEVEAILGGPARDESRGRVVLDHGGGRQEEVEMRAALYEKILVESFHSQAAGGRSRRLLEWHSNQVTIWVLVDNRAVVTNCNSIPRRRADEGLLDHLRRWLGLWGCAPRTAARYPPAALSRPRLIMSGSLSGGR
jgi:hypothetical protein